MQSVSLPVIKEMIFRATPITATRAREIGIANQVVPASALDSTVAAMISDILSNSPLAITLIKEHDLQVLAQPLRSVPAPSTLCRECAAKFTIARTIRRAFGLFLKSARLSSSAIDTAATAVIAASFPPRPTPL